MSFFCLLLRVFRLELLLFLQMDKSSILEEAVKYIKQLKEEEKKLEVQSRETANESLVIMKKAESFEVGDEDEIQLTPWKIPF